MESILSLFIFHDTYVVSLLVVGITIIVVMLLLFNQKSPKSLIDSEFEGPERIEGALRRVLGEQNWQAANNAPTPGVSDSKLKELESELLEKDQTIANLNKQLTHGGGGGGGDGDDSDLMARIAELEARLQEYEIIEDDIADLSLYKSENEKLNEELDRLKAMAGQSTPVADSEPVAEAAPQPEPEPTPSPVEESNDAEEIAESINQSIDVDDGNEDMGADLVAEFEKVVSSQEMLNNDDEGEDSGQVSQAEDADHGKVTGPSEEASGKVIMSGTEPEKKKVPRNIDPDVHPKLRKVSPDSKEEAEVFISELKTIKKGNK